MPWWCHPCSRTRAQGKGKLGVRRCHRRRASSAWPCVLSTHPAGSRLAVSSPQLVPPDFLELGWPVGPGLRFAISALCSVTGDSEPLCPRYLVVLRGEPLQHQRDAHRSLASQNGKHNRAMAGSHITPCPGSGAALPGWATRFVSSYVTCQTCTAWDTGSRQKPCHSTPTPRPLQLLHVTP